MTVEAVPFGNQQTAIKNRTAAMENDRTAAAAPTKLKTSDELRGNNSIRNIDIEQIFRSGRSIGSNHGDETRSEHSSVPFSIRRRTTTNIPATPGVEEIATWFQQIIEIHTSEEALAFAQKAVNQFGLQSTAEVEAQFRPPETTSRRSSPEWITVAHKQKHRPSTTIPPLEGTTGTRGTSPNRFEALSYKGSDRNSSGTPISSITTARDIHTQESSSQRRHCPQNASVSYINHQHQADCVSATSDTHQHGPPNKGSHLNEQSAIAKNTEQDTHAVNMSSTHNLLVGNLN